MKEKLHALLDQLIEQQEERLLTCGRAFVPHLTSEDVLQPFDYPELEQSPHFRYEEGMLHGLQSAKAACLAFCKD